MFLLSRTLTVFPRGVLRCKIVLISLVVKQIINIIMDALNVCNLKSYPPSSHCSVVLQISILLLDHLKDIIGRMFKRNENRVFEDGI